jgi:hypothetical protein
VSKGGNMEITFYTKNVYGLELKYPVSRDAVMICELMGKKTLTEWAIDLVKANDATVDEVLKPRDERGN